MKVSKLASNLIGSEIIKIGNEVNDLKVKGAQISNLTIGDLNSNIYPIPSELKQGIEKAYKNNLTNYPPANGVQSLRTSVSNDLKKRWNLDYSANDILNEKRLNKVNLRKEFFRVDISELESIVTSIDPTAEFNKTMVAEQYRQTLSIEEEQNISA